MRMYTSLRWWGRCCLAVLGWVGVGVRPARAQAGRDRAASAPVTAFVDVGVVPMDSERVLSHQTVLVRGDRIAAMGPADQVSVPEGAVRIAGQGRYLIPGLADMHAHVSARFFDSQSGPGDSVPADSLAAWQLFRWLADGVTTVRDVDYANRSGALGKTTWLFETSDLLRFRALAARGKILSPRIYTAGQWGPDQYIFSESYKKLLPPNAPSPRLDSIAAYVARYKAAGYDFIKLHNESPEIFDSVLVAARRVGIPVVGHVRSTLDHALALGMRSIEHMTGYNRLGIYADSSVEAIARATARAGTWNCVTMAAGGSGAAARGLVRALQDAGAGLLLGTDYPLASYHVSEELERLTKSAGLTPYEALATGTRNVAVYFGTLRDAGTIAVGKRADLVLLAGNPLQDIRQTASPAGVMLGGQWLPREVLDRRLAAIEAAQSPKQNVPRAQPRP